MGNVLFENNRYLKYKCTTDTSTQNKINLTINTVYRIIIALIIF